MSPLYRCNRCAYEEWRAVGKDVDLCPVCGYTMWEEVAGSDEDADKGSSPDRGDVEVK